MPSVKLTDALRDEYERLFACCVIRPERAGVVEATVDKLIATRARYANVGDPLSIPWFVVAVIHNMESTRDFSTHLHNGDPLAKRTVRVPADRPRTGSPPFTWEQSATDALTFKRLGPQTDWSLAGTLYQLERYNGWGYRLYHPHVLSPYLWAFSENYESGKYVADGRWSETAVSNQCGAAVLLRRLAERGLAELRDQPPPPADTAPLVPRFSRDEPSDPAVVEQVRDLQHWLNTYPGIFLKVDGVPGPRTSAAYERVTGARLPGDPEGG